MVVLLLVKLPGCIFGLSRTSAGYFCRVQLFGQSWKCIFSQSHLKVLPDSHSGGGARQFDVESALCRMPRVRQKF